VPTPRYRSTLANGGVQMESCSSDTTTLTAEAGLSLGPWVVMPERVLSNAETVARFAGTFDSGSLRKSFLRALNAIQQLTPNLCSEADRTTLLFDVGNACEKEALCRIMAVDDLPADWGYPASEHAMIARRIEEAWKLINRASPAVRASIQTIIGSLSIARLAGFEGGSVSSVIGVIWVGLACGRPAIEFAELLVHEYVHNSLFLEDMVHGLFIDGEQRLGQPDGLVTSAILQIPRGYDKSFHSAFVAVVLAELNRRLGRNKRHAALLAPVTTTVRGLLAKQQFLTVAGRETLADLRSWVAAHCIC
jgi:hypothetical protein